MERYLWIARKHKSIIVSPTTFAPGTDLSQKQTLAFECLMWFHWLLYFMVRRSCCSHTLIIRENTTRIPTDYSCSSQEHPIRRFPFYFSAHVFTVLPSSHHLNISRAIFFPSATKKKRKPLRRHTESAEPLSLHLCSVFVSLVPFSFLSVHQSLPLLYSSASTWCNRLLSPHKSTLSKYMRQFGHIRLRRAI